MVIRSLFTLITPGLATSPRMVTLKFKNLTVTKGSFKYGLMASSISLLNCLVVFPKALIVPTVGSLMTPSSVINCPGVVLDSIVDTPPLCEIILLTLLNTPASTGFALVTPIYKMSPFWMVGSNVFAAK